MILRWSDSQFWLRGLISSPGLLLNRSGLEFWSYSDFSVHMVFMCRFCKPECSAAFLSKKLAPRWRDSYYIIVSTSGFDVLIECTDFMHVPKHSLKMKNMIIFWPWCTGPVPSTSSLLPPYYSYRAVSTKLYESLLPPRGRAFKWFAASAERKCILNIEKSSFPAVLRCFSWFSYFLNFEWF